MDIDISTRLKHLRREREITQEELAGVLGVSFQSVSKWERGDCYPDINMLPALANYFEISVDDLLGMEEIRDEARIEAARKRADEMYAAPDCNRDEAQEEATALWRELVRDMPHNHELQLEFVGNYLMFGSVMSENAQVSQAREAIAILERILARSTDSDVRARANAFLLRSYSNAGETERAIKMAKKLPTAQSGRENATWYLAVFDSRYRELVSFEDTAELLHQNVANLAGLTAAAIASLRGGMGTIGGAEPVNYLENAKSDGLAAAYEEVYDAINRLSYLNLERATGQKVIISDDGYVQFQFVQE
ncbi:MAG: helix-turn-helix domain-containing protein [Oscillospiraceae bacterium]|jgi:transcriptional regulator with XRE-family HTH domain|nr:helix-turn-helix domain-containing protein [Oscillospiraceae bacterium]